MSESDSWDINYSSSQVNPNDSQLASKGQNSKTVLGFGSTIEGKLILTEDSVISGAVKGEISATGVLTVAESATVQGNISGENIRVAGTVNGDISSSDRIELLGEASLFGDIRCKRLSISDGVTFEGRSTMDESVEESKNQAKIVDSSAESQPI